MDNKKDDLKQLSPASKFEMFGFDISKISNGGVILALLAVGTAYMQTHDNLTKLQYDVKMLQAQILDLKKIIEVDISQKLEADIKGYIDLHDAYINNKIVDNDSVCKDRYGDLSGRITNIEQECIKQRRSQ